MGQPAVASSAAVSDVSVVVDVERSVVLDVDFVDELDELSSPPHAPNAKTRIEDRRSPRARRCMGSI
jgi:hypothetical protein